MPTNKQPGLTSGRALMQHGPHVLYEYLAMKFETAMQHSMPQLEIRFRNLSLSADIVIMEEKSEDGNTVELPTLPHTFNKAASGLLAKRHVVRKEILQNVSGVFKPGTITLVLGQPGSGKSSLMKLLSGQFPMNKNVVLEGEVTYNGQSREDIYHVLPQFVAYVAQRDSHFPTLTVQETLQFAHTFCGGELARRGNELLVNGTINENSAAIAAANAIFNHYPEVIIEQLGLQSCQDTIVGNAMLRGVSGGERKRVTTGEMEFGMKYATMMDEISTGLDSTSTYDIINTQRSIAKCLRKTIVIALLQPAPEVFSLFDDVLILNEGHIIYHGPTEKVVDYFQELGFVCPPTRDVADFLLDLGTDQQHQYEINRSPLDGRKLPRFASEFADVFRQSEVYQEMYRSLDAPLTSELLRTVDKHMNKMPAFHQSFWENTCTLMRREMMVMLRNTAFLKGRAFMLTVIGLLYGSTFWQFDPTDVQLVLGIMFQCILFLALGQAARIPTYMAARDIFYKQRAANFFRTVAYVVASGVGQLPLAVGESVFFGSLVYWMCGFVATVEAYIIFLLLLVLTNLVFASWFFCLSAMSLDFHIAKPMSTFSIVFFVIFGGFVIAKSEIADYFIWIYWLNPIAWCLRAVAVNQYRSPTFNVCKYGNINYCSEFNGMKMGEYFLSTYDIPSETYWIWVGMAFMVASYLFFVSIAYFVLEYKRYEISGYVTLTKKFEPNDQGKDNNTINVDNNNNLYALSVTPKNSNPSSSFSGSQVTIEVQEERQHTRENRFVPITLAFQDLWYSVPMPRNPKQSVDLLKGISGYALPGTMTALMGSSGAGKTTLMDVIAGRKTGGKITGKILLNGYPATDLAIRRCTGYCEQMDIHSEASTFREALIFSAFLRQDSDVPDRDKLDSVQECLDVLDLHSIADQIIRGSSIEQMKRLTIGVELVAQPSVLFLDEPTSGLDARSAKMIMDGVRKVANTGRTVICTIHQPSTDVFALFDHLLLLKRGGNTVFFGELGNQCHELVKYFEAIPGISPLPNGHNPATWMLECIGAGVTGNTTDTSSSEQSQIDFVEYFNISEKKKLLDANLAMVGISRPSPDVSELVFTRKRAASSLTQMRMLLTRFTRMYWRTPSYNLTRMAIPIVLGLLFGVVYLNVDFTTYQGINAGIAMMYLLTEFNGVVSLNGVLPITSEERNSFYRERAAQTYNCLWYFVGATVIEIPYALCQGFLFTVIFYFMVGFRGFVTFLFFWLNVSLGMLLETYMGQVLVYALPSVEVAAILAVLFNTIFFTFMGFNPPASAIPSGYAWVYAITPHRYSMAILAALVFADCPTQHAYDDTTSLYSNVGPSLGCQPLCNMPITIEQMTVKEYVESMFHMKHSDLWSNFGYVILSLVIFRVLALLALRFINHQKR